MWIVLEFVVFIWFVVWLGFFTSILLIILSSVVGYGVLQSQGASTLRRMQEKMQLGEPAAGEMLEGMALAFGGFLLLIPGFLSSILGLILLIPGLRGRIADKVMHKSRVFVRPGAETKPANDDGRVIEGDFKHED